MSLLCSTQSKLFWSGIALALAWVCHGPALAIERSDILLDIVSHCVDPAQPNYCSACRAPRNDARCGAALECRKSTEVWALDTSYTAIRDIKMCGCPSGFVHGLALPLSPVRGVEDPKRPNGIWQFAWDVAASRIETESLALVVNPQFHRSQNQLHVHLLRLSKEGRQLLARHAPSSIKNLDQVWASAAQDAQAKGLTDYGVLVTQQGPKDYLVVVTAESPEDAFTEWRCE
ncbi:MAG: CDP-diacylglycerol diphosphatase [Comamonadaceae bacterium]